MIGTGGSISCIGDSRVDLLNYNYADKHLTIEEMVARIPEAGEIADIRAEQFLNVYGGDVTPSQWLQLARRIEQIFREDNDAAGVVVTHGTSTLEETAYFLHLAVRSPNPVVITGAMRPPTAISTDAVETFKSGELGFLGYADSDGKVVFLRDSLRAKPATGILNLDKLTAFPRVDIAYAYSGVDGVAVRAMVDAGCAGIVSAGLGSGSVPRAFLDAVREAHKSGVCIVMASHSGNGRVMAKRSFTEKGFVVADSLAPKKVRILLMLALAQTRDAKEIQRMMLAY